MLAGLAFFQVTTAYSRERCCPSCLDGGQHYRFAIVAAAEGACMLLRIPTAAQPQIQLIEFEATEFLRR